jgi:hypothetical protein
VRFPDPKIIPAASYPCTEYSSIPLPRKLEYETSTNVFPAEIPISLMNTIAGVEDGELLGTKDGELLDTNDGALLDINDGDLLGRNDDELLGRNDGELLGINDGALLSTNDGVASGAAVTGPMLGLKEAGGIVTTGEAVGSSVSGEKFGDAGGSVSCVGVKTG